MSSIHGTPAGPLHILDTRLHADPSRVVLRPFHLGWQAKHTRSSRALDLVEDIAGISEKQVRSEYERILADFGERHWQTEGMFRERWKEVEHTLGLADRHFSATRKKLIGA